MKEIATATCWGCPVLGSAVSSNTKQEVKVSMENPTCLKKISAKIENTTAQSLYC